MLLEREWTLKHEESLIPTLGGRIRHARVAKGYDTLERFRLALESSGVRITKSGISDIERNMARPSLEILIGIAKFLDRSLDWLCCMPEHIETVQPDEPIYSDDALEVAYKLDSLPLEIKNQVVDEALKLIQERYDAYDVKREFKRLMSLVVERGDGDILASVKRIIAAKSISNGV